MSDDLRKWIKRGTGSKAEYVHQLTKALDEIERLRADLARPKVKDLIWEPTFISGEHLRDVALGGLGGLIAYEVGVKEHYVLVNGRRLGIKKLGDFESLEAAKAAAQADFEQRILSALEGYE